MIASNVMLSPKLMKNTSSWWRSTFLHYTELGSHWGHRVLPYGATQALAEVVNNDKIFDSYNV